MSNPVTHRDEGTRRQLSDEDRRRTKATDWLTPVERSQLRQRVYDLFGFRDSAYLRDGIEDLIEWWLQLEPELLQRALSSRNDGSR